MLNISDFPWAECAITENRTLYVSDSLSLKRHKRNTGIHRYELELVTTEMTMKEGRGVMAKLSAASEDTLYFVHPRLGFTQGVEPSSGVDASGITLKGSKEVSMTSGEAWQLIAGDYIAFANDTKVYQVAEDTSDAIGLKTVKLTSEVRNDISNGSGITMNNVPFYLTSDGVIEVGMVASDNQDMQITLTAVEKL